MILQESGENYLETILMLQQQNGSVRSIDNAYEFYQSQRQQGYEYFKTRKLHSDGSGRQHHSD